MVLSYKVHRPSANIIVPNYMVRTGTKFNKANRDALPVSFRQLALFAEYKGPPTPRLLHEINSVDYNSCQISFFFMVVHKGKVIEWRNVGKLPSYSQCT